MPIEHGVIFQCYSLFCRGVHFQVTGGSFGKDNERANQRVRGVSGQLGLPQKPGHECCILSVMKSYPIFFGPGSPVNQTKWLVFRMIHSFRIPDPTNGQSLVF